MADPTGSTKDPREEILAAAWEAFERGCEQAAGGAIWTYEADLRQAVRDHYEQIFKARTDEIVKAYGPPQDDLWRDAIATVEKTGQAAMGKASAGLAEGQQPCVEPTHFEAAWTEVEGEKLATGLGSNWCG